MARFWRAIKWTALALGGLLSLAVIAAAIYARTDNFNRWAREQMVGAVNDAIRGSLAVERLEGSLWSKLTIYHATLSDDRGEILKLPRTNVAFSLLPLIFGRLQIAQLDATGPQVLLRQDRDGKWNLIEALSPRAPEPESKGGLTTLVRSLRLSGGVIEIGLAGAETYRLHDLSLKGDLAVRPAGVGVNLAEISSLVNAESMPELRVEGALDYQASGALSGVLNVKDFWAVSRHSRVKVNGQITEGKPVKISARVALEKLASADIAHFAPGVRLEHDIAGRLSVDGALDALQGDLELGSAGATMAGKFHADVAGEQPRYTASLALNGLNLRTWLGGQNLAGVVSGTAEVAGDGFTLAKTTGKTRMEIRSAEVQGWGLGLISVEGQLQDSVAGIDGRLKSKLGGADWRGKIALGESKPSYELVLSVNNLDVQQTMRSGEALQGELNFQGTVKGAGLNPDEMNTRADLRVQPSTLGPVNINRGELRAIVNDKKVRIERAALSAADSTLSVAGELGLDAKMSGKLDYRLRVADVSPWLALVQRKGSGTLDLSGVARGNLADLKSEGTARLSGIRADGVSTRQGNIKFALQASKEELFPQGIVTISLDQVDAGIPLRRLAANAKLSRRPTDSVQLEISAEDAHNRRHALAGSVGFPAEGLTVHLTQVSLALADGPWKLARPATLTQRGEQFVVDQLTLQNGAQGLSVRGGFGLAGEQDLALDANGIPLKSFAEFMPKSPDMTGRIGLTARIGGTAATPEISASARLSDATIAGQKYQGATADASYKDKRIYLRLAVQQDRTHALNGAGTLPADLSWQNGLRVEFADGIDFRLRSDGLSLAFLNAFSGKSVENIGGEVALDLLARGALKQPDLRGQLRLRGGKAKIVPLGLEVNEITLAGNLASQVLTVSELTAKAKDGEIRGSGSLALNDYDVGAFKLALNARRWPAIETTRHRVKIAGNVEVQGTLAAPNVTGQVEVLEGSLRPDLAFLGSGKVPLKRDETIVIVKNNGAGRQPLAQRSKDADSNDSDYYKRLRLDLRVRAPGNLWIRHPEMVTELSGQVQARKLPNQDINLIGRIEMNRGWFAFQSRRFELARGVVEFTGGDEINPSLDLLAQYRLPDYRVDAAIGGTAEKPSLTLTSTPPLEQADILALLVFGKPIAALNQKEQGALQQSAFGITSGFVAGRIANSVSQALGLDGLGVDISDVDFAGGQVGLGRYIGRDTYVSVSQQLSGERGREVSLEYQIVPDWKIGTSTSSTGSNGIDVIWHKRY